MYIYIGRLGLHIFDNNKSIFFLLRCTSYDSMYSVKSRKALNITAVHRTHIKRLAICKYSFNNKYISNNHIIIKLIQFQVGLDLLFVVFFFSFILKSYAVQNYRNSWSWVEFGIWKCVPLCSLLCFLYFVRLTWDSYKIP